MCVDVVAAEAELMLNVEEERGEDSLSWWPKPALLSCLQLGAQSNTDLQVKGMQKEKWGSTTATVVCVCG